MKTLSIASAAFALFATSNAVAGPAGGGKCAPNHNGKKVCFLDIAAGGPGCPQGSYSTLLTATKPGGPIDFFEVIYDDFSVEKYEGSRAKEARKHCTVAVDMFIPQGWQFSLVDVHYEGFADIQRGSMGTLNTSYFFPQHSNRVSTSKRLRGPFVGDYNKEDTIGIFSKVWSPCGLKIPLNMKSTLHVRGRGDAFMTVDQQTGKLTQKWGFSWRKCN